MPKIQKISDDKEVFDEKFNTIYTHLEGIRCGMSKQLASIERTTEERLSSIEKNNSNQFLFFEKIVSEKLDRIHCEASRTNGHVAELFEKDRQMVEAMIKADKELEVRIAKVNERLNCGWGYFIRENPKLIAAIIFLILASLGINLFDISI